ncbi:MAG: redox-regulated ATPase YchF [Methanomassiliicoccales archaeon]|jgi:ribosome-binding ATPase YchF (GTP1/OBG family)|nr:redox-regulated ATPase YchF [Methanomassiliicoccales archaeon]
MQIGIVGKPNVGKSTFFSAATLATVEIADYPFTTIKPNRGVAYIRAKCPHTEFGIKCNPRNSACENGIRLVPIELLDVAGLVPDAWQGRGLGNKFLDDLRQAAALIHIVDASGGTDEEGNKLPPGSHDPLLDIRFLEREIAYWIKGILEKGFAKVARQAHLEGMKIEKALHERLTGLGVSETDVIMAIKNAGLPDNPMYWQDADLLRLADAIRKQSKPMIIALNKADVANEVQLSRLMNLEGYITIPVCAESELGLKRAAKAGLVRYIPGDKDFTIVDPQKLNESQKKALDYFAKVMKKCGHGTGVQTCLEKAVYDLLDMIVVYPVEDDNKLTDHDGNVLPDAYLVKRGSNARDLAYKIHTELGDNFVRAINARTHRTVGHDYILQNGDVITIVARK